MNINKIEIRSPAEIIINKNLRMPISIILKDDEQKEEEKKYVLIKTKSNKLLLNKFVS